MQKENELPDKPWVVVGDDVEMQKLIYKKDQRLVYFKNVVMKVRVCDINIFEAWRQQTK